MAPNERTNASSRSTARRRPAKKHPATNRTALIIGICAVVSVVLLVGIIFGIVALVNRNKDDGRILENVCAGGVNLGGMTVEEAKNALHLATDSTFSAVDMVIQLPDAEIRLAPDKTGAKLNIDAVVAEAYAYGRTGTAEEQAAIRQSAATTTRTIALLPYLNLRLPYIQSAIRDFCNSYSSVMTQPTVELIGSRPVYIPPEDPKDPDQPTQPTKPPKPVVHQKLKVTMGTPNYILNPDTLYNRVLDAYSLNEMTLKYQAPTLTEPQKPNAESIFQQHCLWPEDAVLDEVTFAVTPEVYGYGFDAEALQRLIDAADYGQVIEITLNFIMPEVTAKDLTKDLFLDMLSSNITTSNMGDAWNKNLQLSCAAINNYVIKSGEEFSFNMILGRPSTDKGYQKAPGYRNGKDAMVVGSGISQTASTLYYCLLKADLEIVERHASTYTPVYADLGLDAYVNWGAQDLRFRNNTASPIRIIASAEGGTVTIQLFGVDERDYDVQLTTQTVATHTNRVIYQKMDKNNILGYTDGYVLQTGITGCDVQANMVKYDKVTGAMLSDVQISLSQYTTRDQIVIKLVQDAPTTPPTTPPTTLPTEPQEPVTPDPELPDQAA